MKKKLLMMGITGLSFLVSTNGFSQAPVADFSISEPTTCVNSTVQLTDLSTNTPTSWSYTVASMAGTLTAQNPTLSFSTFGDFDVTLVATNGSGTSAPITKTISVKSLPSITVAAASAVCAGSSATLSASGALTYTWANGPATGGSFVPVATNDYTVTGTDGNNCKNTAMQTVSVNALPSLTVSGTNSICAGTPITETVTGADTYSWSTGISGDNINETPVVTTTYTVTGTNSLTGCENAITKVVNVDAYPTVSVTSGSVCAGSVFTIAPTGAASYTFSNGSNTVIPVTNDSYTVTGASALGCTSSITAIASVTVNALPTVTVNAGTICAGGIFTLTPGGAVSYNYQGGSNTVTAAASTNFTVTGTDANGCTSIPAVANITVNALPTVTVNSGAICAGDSFTITPNGTATSYTYINGANIVTPASSLAYSVTGTDANGCVSAIAVSNVTVNALPTLTVNSGVICAGASFTINPSGAATYVYSGGSNVVTPAANQSYSVTGTDANGCVTAAAAVVNVTVNALPTITVNSGAICAGASFTIVANGASTYVYAGGSDVVTPTANQSYSVTGTDANGCVSAAAVSNVTVNALPVTTANNATICVGNSYTIVPNGASTYVYSGGSNIVTPATTTSYSITGTDANGCTSAAPAVISVSVAPAVTVAVSGGTTICSGNAANLTANGASSYVWSSGAVTNTVALLPTSNTSYTVVGTTGTCTNAAVISVSVNQLPSVAVTVLSQTICTGESTTLTSTGAVSYSWNSGETTANITITPSSTTSYTVTGVGANGCSNKSTVTQNVDACTGIAQQAGNFESGIYPNPTKGSFTVKVAQSTSIRIINIVGQSVYAAELTEGENAVSLNDQIDGVYFVQLQQNGHVKTMKVVKN